LVQKQETRFLTAKLLLVIN